MPLTPGLYDKVVIRLLARQIESLDEALEAELAKLDAADAPAVLALALHHAVGDALLQVEGPQALQQRVAICNSILQLLKDSLPQIAAEADNWHIDDNAQRLLGVWPAAERPATRPQTSPALSALLTGTRIDVSLLSQLKSEMRSADRIDILCSFIKWSGLRVLEGELRAFTARPGAELRVITTSYMGATDIKAVEFLRALPNTRVKISYDAQRTRLHAKAYLFHRATCFGTAYVGSSNLSHAAITDGLEWNVKVSQYESAHLWTKLCGTFETYWQDAEFRCGWRLIRGPL
jgi:HKD family nuclease